MSHFLTEAVSKLLTYKTPKKITDYIKQEQIKSIIKNPPYNAKHHSATK